MGTSDSYNNEIIPYRNLDHSEFSNTNCCLYDSRNSDINMDLYHKRYSYDELRDSHNKKDVTDILMKKSSANIFDKLKTITIRCKRGSCKY